MNERIIGDPEAAKRALSEYGEQAPEWPFANEKKDVNATAQILKNRLIDPVLQLHRAQMPDPIIGFDDAGNVNVLAFYRKVPNAHGLPNEIILNTAHYEEKDGVMQWKYGLWSRDEVLCHEMAHGLLNFIAKLEGRKIPAHGKEFTELLEKWGLHPLLNHGAHTQVADADKPFGILMTELGRTRPDDVVREDERPNKRGWFLPPKKPKGRSTIHKEVCPSCSEIRYSTKKEPKPIICAECGTTYIRAEKGTIYPKKK